MEQLEMILQNCSEVSGVSIEKIKSKDRFRHIVVVRQIYCYIAKKYFSYTLLEIGKSINRDHSSVIHSIELVEKMIELNDPLICSHYEAIMDKLKKERKKEIVFSIMLNDLVDPNTMVEEIQKKYDCIMRVIY
jgi:hypothetical protein